MGSKSKSNISRRNFLRTSATTVSAAAGASVMAEHPPSPFVSEATASETPKAVPQSNRVIGYCGEGDWLGTPPVIADSKIKKTINVDVLVLGGGHAGVLAALGASDKGAKVAVIEKMDEAGFTKDPAHFLGEDIDHVNSKWLISRGYGPFNTGEIVAEFVKRSAGRCNPEIIRLFVENSGAMFDRMAEAYQGALSSRQYPRRALWPGLQQAYYRQFDRHGNDSRMACRQICGKGMIISECGNYLGEFFPSSILQTWSEL
jgi:hypothetical protein